MDKKQLRNLIRECMMEIDKEKSVSMQSTTQDAGQETKASMSKTPRMPTDSFGLSDEKQDVECQAPAELKDKIKSLVASTLQEMKKNKKIV